MISLFGFFGEAPKKRNPKKGGEVFGWIFLREPLAIIHNVFSKEMNIYHCYHTSSRLVFFWNIIRLPLVLTRFILQSFIEVLRCTSLILDLDIAVDVAGPSTKLHACLSHRLVKIFRNLKVPTVFKWPTKVLVSKVFWIYGERISNLTNLTIVHRQIKGGEKKHLL